MDDLTSTSAQPLINILLRSNEFFGRTPHVHLPFLVLGDTAVSYMPPRGESSLDPYCYNKSDALEMPSLEASVSWALEMQFLEARLSRLTISFS